MKSISIVHEFMDGFPIDVSGVSLYIDIDFDIDMERVTTPIYIPPSHMALAELKRLMY